MINPYLIVYSIALNTCKVNIVSYCNVFDALAHKSEYSVNCTSDQKVFPTYPGGNCNSNNECLFGICIKNKCSVSDINRPCYTKDDCPIGAACIKLKCEALHKKGEQCEESTECEYNLVCYKKACIEMYSLDDGTILSLAIKQYIDEN